MDRVSTKPCMSNGFDHLINYSDLNFTFVLQRAFTNDNLICLNHKTSHTVPAMLSFYSYATPFLILVGLVGNILSLTVFLSKSMRRLSASIYLSALSVSDLVALFSHVLIDWLRRGAPNLAHGQPYETVTSALSIFEVQGLCQAQMFLSYVARFLSAWIIVTFTLERYIGVCHPLKRQGLFFGSRSSRKIIFCLLIISLVVAIYKPLLTGRYEYRVRDRVIAKCSRNPSFPIVSFTLDSIFAVFISFVPFVIISVLNTLIICRLRRRYRRNFRRTVITNESIVRMEFTIIFLITSFVFIALNLPFFCFWCKRFLLSFYNTRLSTWDEAHQNWYLASRLVFYMNYSINFFLYSVSGAYFRRQLRLMFVTRKYGMHNSCSRLNNNENNNTNQSTPHSWV